MKVSRIRPDTPAGRCGCCHNQAIIDVLITPDRPNLRLCHRCAKYLAVFLGNRLEEYDAGKPIPAPRAPRSENWGNR
jgi:hypothetical protein